MNYRKIKREGLGLKILEEILYIFFVVFGYYLAFLLRFNWEPPEYNTKPFFENIPYIIVISVVVFYIYDVVDTLKKSFSENALIIFISVLIIDMATVTLMFFKRGFTFPRTVIAMGFLIQFALILMSKVLILKILTRFIGPKDVLVVANNEEADYLENKLGLDSHRKHRDRIKYKVDENHRDIPSLIDDVEKVYIGNKLHFKTKENIVNYASEKGKTIYLVPSLYEISLVDFKTRQADDLLLFKLNDLGLSLEERIVKRIMDFLISLTGLVVLSPLILVIALIIKLSDGGEVFYKQERVTENNRVFNIYKFRTMVIDAEEQSGPVLAMKTDPRITPVGRILRSTRLDEIPQLINVLVGDMSVVGPRPERPFFVEYLNRETEGFKYRTQVKAGITGLAQVMGTYATSPEEKAKYDLLYIRNYSLLGDIKLIFDTVRIVCMKDSSQGIAEASTLNISRDLDKDTLD